MLAGGPLDKVKEVSWSCPALCNPRDCSPPGSSIHGILQARVLEWVAIAFSRGSSQPRDQTQVSRTAGGRPPGEALDKGKKNRTVSKWGCSEGGGIGGKTKVVQASGVGASGKREPSADGTAHGFYLCSS